jgi:subtilisin family serine protease/formylglycine-generating enzyme required for sulfatase activity
LEEGATLVSVPGDYNGNGVVDAADYVVWRDTLDSPGQLAADGDRNGVTDQADYILWKSNFGNTDGPTKFISFGGSTATEVVENEWIIQLKDSVNAAKPSDVVSILEPFGIKVLEGTGTPKELLVNAPADDLSAANTLFTATGLISVFEPNIVLRAAQIPNDKSFPDLWGMNNTGQDGGLNDADIDAAEAWDGTTGSDGIVVAVIDTGVDYNHPELKANMWTNPGEIPANGKDDDNNGFIDDIHGYNFVSNNGNPVDNNGHGTHVAGTIGAVANNDVGVAGVAWNVEIMALKFLNAQGSGTTSDAEKAVNYATLMRRDKNVNVVATNNSWGGGGFSTNLRDAIADSGNQGILFVAAAGNFSRNNDVTPFYPASYDLENIIAVAATDRRDQLAGFSHIGQISVDLAAPGVDILSTLPSNRYDSFNGTSMATPHVSGVVALARAIAPSFTSQQIRQAIFDGVDVLPQLGGQVATGGRLNALKALDPLRTPKLSIAAVSAVKLEGDAGTNPATSFIFRVTRSEHTSGTTSVNYAVTGSGSNPASASDFFGNALPSGSVSFNPSEVMKDITIQVIGDTTFELDEGFTVTLSGASGPAVIVTPAANGIIQNDDPVPPTAGVTIIQSGGSTDVNEAGPTTDTYTISLNSVPTASVQITVTADAQTDVSLNGVDFASSVSFIRNNTASQTITVRAIDDEVEEAAVHSSTIGHAITSSGDPNYPFSLPIPSITANVTDNDSVPPPLEFVTIGNPRNLPDADTGLGSVDRVYQIGKFEVTAGQYAEFLNAVAKTDTFGLYNPLMDYDANPAQIGCNIKRSGSQGSYSYIVAPEWANRPVNYVSLWDAARFINWLHNGRPSGPQGPGTTEDGAYHDIGNRTLFGRNPGAKFFIPTEDEWYKAAYHKNNGATANYWDYPTQEDEPDRPINTLPDPGNHANFFDILGTGNSGYTIGAPYYRTPVGTFSNSPSPYGTFDQGGNIWEWTEAALNFSSHSVLGGSSNNWWNSLLAGNHYAGGFPEAESDSYGFRVAAAVPPSAIETVLVGNPGNVDDSTGYGGVSYVYRMGKAEVTTAQYVEFLNAVADLDTNDLYSPLMGSDLGGGIVRSGSSGSYVYGIKPPATGKALGGADYTYADKPIAFVSWYDALRFANWLHNGRPVGAQNDNTTENGAYDFDGPTSVGPRKPGAKWFLPSEDEWYKAAYHKNDGPTSNYWDYATGSDTTSASKPPVPLMENSANFRAGTAQAPESFVMPFAPDHPHTDVMAYALSESPYGTFDQGGNVWEWMIDAGTGQVGVRGASFNDFKENLHAELNRNIPHGTTAESLTIGFRVAATVDQAASATAGESTVYIAGSRYGSLAMSSAPSDPPRRSSFFHATFDGTLTKRYQPLITKNLQLVDSGFAAYSHLDSLAGKAAEFEIFGLERATAASGSPRTSLERDIARDWLLSGLDLER